MEVLRRRRDGGQVGDRDQGDEEVEEPLGANESQDLVSLVHFLARRRRSFQLRSRPLASKLPKTGLFSDTQQSPF